MSDYLNKLERLTQIRENNQWDDKRDEALTIIKELLSGTYPLSEARMINETLSEYIPLLLTIMTEDENYSMRKSVFRTLKKMTSDSIFLLEAVKLFKLGIEDGNFSWSIGQELMDIPEAYLLLKEAILELLQSPGEYHQRLGLGIIREYRNVIRSGKAKTTKARGAKTLYPTTTLTQELLANDWLLIVRNMVREGKTMGIKDQAWSALNTIANIDEEKELLKDEYAYVALHEILLKLQAGIQVPLTRIFELAAPLVELKIDEHNFARINKNTITKELFDRLIKEILANEDISGEYFELEQVFVRKDGKERYSLTASTFAKKYVCHNCGMPIEKDTKTCLGCNQEILRCNVCKLPISFGEEAGKCSLCESKGHLTHFQEWVKTQGKCPTCMKKIPIEGIVPLSGELKK